MSKPTKKDHRLGHRERLRKRFLSGGADALSDYELLELVLFRAIPRRDIKKLAKDLIARFGDFAGVLSAEPARLLEISGLGGAAITEIKLVEAAAQRLTLGKVIKKPVLSSWSALLAHCKASIGRADTECFHIFFLDKKNILIADEKQQKGTVDHVSVYPREVVKRALELSASSIILVHNHPSGDPTPSKADIDMTRQIIEAGRTMGIRVHDHLIIGGEHDVSFRNLGLI